MNPNTQSIIVYRNPMEQQIWESGLVAPIICTGIVFIIALVMIMAIVDKTQRIMKRRINGNWITYVAMALSAFVAYHTFIRLT